MIRKSVVSAVVLVAASLWAALSFENSLLGAELIEAPSQVQPYKLVDVKVTGEWEGVIYSVEPEAAVDQRPTPDGKGLLWVAPPGTYTIRAVCVNFSAKKISQGKRVVVIEGKPKPDPDPKPDPKPDPDPQPTPVGPLHVLVVYEQEDLDKYPLEQSGIITSRPVRDYLDAHCGNDAATGKPAYRFLDKDADPALLVSPWWAEALKAAKTFGKYPCIVIATEKAAVPVGALPANAAETIKLLQKYGGK